MDSSFFSFANISYCLVKCLIGQNYNELNDYSFDKQGITKEIISVIESYPDQLILADKEYFFNYELVEIEFPKKTFLSEYFISFYLPVENGESELRITIRVSIDKNKNIWFSIWEVK